MKIKWFAFIIMVVILAGCSINPKTTLSPPSWIQGTWVDPGWPSGTLAKWTFSKTDAVYIDYVTPQNIDWDNNGSVSDSSTSATYTIVGGSYIYTFSLGSISTFPISSLPTIPSGTQTINEVVTFAGANDFSKIYYFQ